MRLATHPKRALPAETNAKGVLGGVMKKGKSKISGRKAQPLEALSALSGIRRIKRCLPLSFAITLQD